MYASEYTLDPHDASTAGVGTAASHRFDPVRLTPIDPPPAVDDADQADPRALRCPSLLSACLKIDGGCIEYFAFEAHRQY